MNDQWEYTPFYMNRLTFFAAMLLLGVGCISVPPPVPAPVNGNVVPPVVNRNAPDPQFCTQEAKLCPDGSAVGRTGPNCEFAPCPTVPTQRSCSGEGDTSCGQGYVCIQACGPPVVREGDAPPPWYCETEANAAKPRMCPICLAATTNIATPSGEVNVQKLTVGMHVWSLDARGIKIVSTIVRVAQTLAPKAHRVVHLVLSDGREVRVSPNHPTITGLPGGQLRAGDAYDGARVISADLEPYGGAATYELLPDSATGAYWADGVLLGSTLFAPYITQ